MTRPKDSALSNCVAAVESSRISVRFRFHQPKLRILLWKLTHDSIRYSTNATLTIVSLSPHYSLLFLLQYVLSVWIFGSLVHAVKGVPRETRSRVLRQRSLFNFLENS